MEKYFLNRANRDIVVMFLWAILTKTLFDFFSNSTDPVFHSMRFKAVIDLPLDFRSLLVLFYAGILVTLKIIVFVVECLGAAMIATRVINSLDVLSCPSEETAKSTPENTQTNSIS